MFERQDFREKMYLTRNVRFDILNDFARNIPHFKEELSEIL